jgi:hypothetical protein
MLLLMLLKIRANLYVEVDTGKAPASWRHFSVHIDGVRMTDATL